MIQPETNAGRMEFYRRRRTDRFRRWFVRSDGAVCIPLNDVATAIIDVIDVDLCRQFVWRFTRVNKTTKGYAVATVPAHLKSEFPFTIVALHRLIMGFPVECDHRDRDGLNCRRSNLRIATRSQNGMNRTWPQSETFHYRGVHRSHRKWVASIQCNRKQIYLGIFSTPEEAALAYNDAALKHHGEFAVLNEIRL